MLPSLPKPIQDAIRSIGLYKRLAILRNHRIRHAYGRKLDNDPYSGFILSDKLGPILIPGGAYRLKRLQLALKNIHQTSADVGYFINHKSLEALLKTPAIARVFPDELFFFQTAYRLPNRDYVVVRWTDVRTVTQESFLLL